MATPQRSLLLLHRRTPRLLRLQHEATEYSSCRGGSEQDSVTADLAGTGSPRGPQPRQQGVTVVTPEETAVTVVTPRDISCGGF